MPKKREERTKMPQLNLFEKVELDECHIEPKTTVRLGSKSASVSLKRKQREAFQMLKELLPQLEGKDILVGQYCDFWWYSGLRLNRLKVQWGYLSPLRNKSSPTVIVLCGNKDAQIRIFLDRLWNVRTQYYHSGKAYHLIDFWNGFGENPIDKYHKAGYQSLHLETVS